jgi:uroporphyrinogen III methyltransferase/synthase
VATLPERAAAMGIHSPAILVVGGVCALAKDFCWFDRLPLKGRRVLVTRPKGRAGTLAEKLRDLGAQVWEYPCIETRPIPDALERGQVLQGLSRYRWLALTSPAGAEYLWAALQARGMDARALAGCRLAVIGPGTAGALARHGLQADYMPEFYDTAHLGEGLPAEGRVLILRAEEGSPALTQALERRGIGYDDVALYRTVYQNPRSEELRAALERGELDLVTFTSASTVKGFVSSVGEGADLSGVVGLCIGAQTAAEAGKHGITVRVAKQATIAALTELAAAYGAEKEEEEQWI